MTVIKTFENENQVKNTDFKAFLITFDKGLRSNLVHYFKHNVNIKFARYLLKKAVDERVTDTGIIYIEDLCLFSYLVAAHKQIEDVLLIWSAKDADFDTWCGFDGELLSFMGIETTINYLKNLETVESEKVLDYMKEYNQVDIDDYFSEEHYYLEDPSV